MGLRAYEVNILETPEAFFEGEEPKSLIAGNGFTMAYPALGAAFGYNNLLSNANPNTSIASMFTTFGTPNFEEILRVYDDSLKVVNIYENTNTNLIQNLRGDAINVKNDFIDSITTLHPDSSANLSAMHTLNCSNFLRTFNKIYTTNYDLFLYWVINSQNLTNHFSDGFTTQGGEGLHWNPEINGQDLFFLHGGLHLFTDANKELGKITSNPTAPIIPQLRQNILTSRYPLVVLEGSSPQKMQAIRRNKYLSFCYRSLGNLSGKLLVYGMSFQFDAHLLKKILDSNVSSIYFCLYGNNAQKQATALVIQSAIRGQRVQNTPAVFFIDASAFTIW